MQYFLSLAWAAVAAASHIVQRAAVDPNDDILNDDWYLDAVKREADGPGANATGSASFESHNLTRSNLDSSSEIEWEIELLVFANITVEHGGDRPDKKENQVGSVLRYMPKRNGTISDDHYVCAAGFVVDGKDHELGDDDDLEEDCSNALSDDCLKWLSDRDVSLCLPGTTPPDSCHAGNQFMHMVRNGTADINDPPSLWLNQDIGDEDGTSLSGDEAYDKVIRQLYVATWGVYSTTQNEDGDKMPGGDEKEYSLRCLRADDVKEGSRTMEDTAVAVAPKIALVTAMALAVVFF